MLKTPSGYVQQSPWLSVSNKQLELMGRYMAELGITPASRSRVASVLSPERELPTVIRVLFEGDDVTERDRHGSRADDDDVVRIQPGGKRV